MKIVGVRSEQPHPQTVVAAAAKEKCLALDPPARLVERRKGGVLGSRVAAVELFLVPHGLRTIEPRSNCVARRVAQRTAMGDTTRSA